MGNKLTDKQKARLWEHVRSPNFQASNRLENIAVDVITLDEATIAQRLETLRSDYER